MASNKKWGFVRETREMATDALKKYPDQVYTGMEDYLQFIFPDTNDWVHDKSVPNLTDLDGKPSRIRPDYRSESLKTIIEFDGLPHYTSPDNILKDVINTKIYESAGYKVVRIPYFIQLTNEVVKELFGIEVQEPLFDSKQHSISHEWKNTPAYLCVEGVFRMAEEYLRFPQQYNVNINHINRDNSDNTRARLLRDLNHTLYYLNSSLKNKHDSLVATFLPKEKLAYLLQLYADAKYCHGIVCPGSGCQLAEDLISGKSVGVMDYYCDDEKTGADFVIREFSLEDLNRALEIVINNKLQYYDILKGVVCESAMCADATQGLVQIAIFGDVWY